MMGDNEEFHGGYLDEKLTTLDSRELMILCFQQDAPDVSTLLKYWNHLRELNDHHRGWSEALIVFSLAKFGVQGFDERLYEQAPFYLRALHEAWAHRWLPEEEGVSRLYRDFSRAVGLLDSRFVTGEQESPRAHEQTGELSVLVEQEIEVDADEGLDEPSLDEIAEPAHPFDGASGRGAERKVVYQKLLHCLQEFLGDNFWAPLERPSGGFLISRRSDVLRFEVCLAQIDEISPMLKIAGAYKVWLSLFFGVQMRSRNIFGRRNQRKQRILVAALEGFAVGGPELMELAPMFASDYTPLPAWQKVAALLLDYSTWLAEHKLDAVDTYDPITRLEQLLKRQGGDRRQIPR